MIYSYVRFSCLFLHSQISAGIAALSWMFTECYVRGRPSQLGMVSGAVAGLVAITPFAGHVNFTGSFFVSLLARPVCFGGAKLKHWIGYDVALDTFGAHAVGGILGGVLLGFFATDEIATVNGVFNRDNSSGGHQLGLQLYGIVVCAGWSRFMSTVLLLAIDRTIGLRVTKREVDEGLDINLHGETIVLEREMYVKKRASVSVSMGAADCEDQHRQDVAYSCVPDAGVAVQLVARPPPPMPPPRPPRAGRPDEGPGCASVCSITAALLAILRILPILPVLFCVFSLSRWCVEMAGPISEIEAAGFHYR